MPDDEVTAQRQLPAGSRGNEDLDEDTAIIQGEDEEQALEAPLRGQPQPQPQPERSRQAPPQEPRQDRAQTPTPAVEARGAVAPRQQSPSQDLSYGDTSEGPTNAGPTRTAAGAQMAAQLAAQPTAAPVTPTAAPSAASPQSSRNSQVSASPLLPSVRVAVVGTPTGDVRVVVLGANEQAPMGSAVGILVPLSERDGATIAKLLRISNG